MSVTICETLLLDNNPLYCCSLLLASSKPEKSSLTELEHYVVNSKVLERPNSSALTLLLQRQQGPSWRKNSEPTDLTLQKWPATGQ